MGLHPHATIASLDGLRAVAVAIVFFAHARIGLPLPGGFGVTLFFFLSGFLITTLFFRESAQTGGIDLGAFYVRRLLRLSPPLLVTLALVYGLVATGRALGEIDPLALISQLFYFYNYYVTIVPDPKEGAQGLNVLWSLSVEEHFYLIWPVMFLLLLRRNMPLAPILGLLVAILVWRMIRLLVFGAEANTIYVSTDTRFDSILYGALLAILHARGHAARLFPQRGLGMWALLGAAGAVLLFCFVYRDPTFRETLRYTLQGIALMPVFHYAVTRADLWLFRPLNWAPMRWIGLYSYSIYLVHFVALINLRAFEIGPTNPVLFSLFVFALCTLYAGLLHRFIETPLRRWRARFTVPT